MSREITSACCGRFTELQQTCPALQGRKQFIASALGALGAGWGLQVWPGTAATLLQGEQENRAVKTHPHSTQTTLQRGNQGTERYKAKQSSLQGTAPLCWGKRKLQTSMLAFAPCEPVPNRNLCCLLLAQVHGTAVPTASGELRHGNCCRATLD